MELLQINDIKILEVRGNVDNQAAEQMEEVLYKLLEDEEKKIVLDFAGVQHICSAALGLLVSYKRELSRLHGEMKLVLDTEYMIQLFEITMLDRVIEIYRTRNEAVGAF